MSNRHVRELQQLYRAIFKDALYAYPTLGVEFERDLARLLRLSEQRGLYVFVEDLPALGKHLDKCLASGQYKRSELPLSKRYSGRTEIPKFLRGLYLLVFDESGSLKCDYDVQAIVFLRQILFAAKKTVVRCTDDQIRDEVAGFVEVDNSLPGPTRFWGMSQPKPTDVRLLFTGFSKDPAFARRIKAGGYSEEIRRDLSVALIALDRVSNALTSTLGDYSPYEWRFKHGPGAVSEVTGPSNKYSWTSWPARLENAFPIADCGYHNYASWASDAISHELDPSESFSRLVDVPKSYLKPRLIAVEPSAHQWCQQNIWDYFCNRTRTSWIHDFVRFRDQSLNQELCSYGALTGTLATVDLSAASDRVSCRVVGNLFRRNPELLIALQATRTRFVRQSQLRDGPALLPLRKFSTMGSACTFPVESLLFLAISLATVATKHRGSLRANNFKDYAGRVAVFGDDIIIPSDCRELLFALLEVLYFKVNVAKSHWIGKFRESCGVDSFGGVNVTPAYWRGPNSNGPESIASTIEVSNNFQKKFMLHSAAYIASTIRGVSIPLVSMDSGVSGLKTFVRPSLSMFKHRWNKVLQRLEIFVPRFITRQRKTPITDDSALLQYFTERPPPDQPWKGGVAERPRLKLKPGWVPDYEAGVDPVHSVEVQGELR